MKKLLKSIILILLVLSNRRVSAQTLIALKQKINQIVEGKNATIGVAIIGVDGQDTLTVNGDNRFPMQSVFKFPIALTVLHFVDQKKLKLSQKIKLTKKDLIPNTYSPIRERFPNGVTLKLSDLINYSVSQSDNIATDILLNLIGGAKSVEAFLKASGIPNVSIKYNEKEQQENWENQYKNWITPLSANLLLKTFYENKKKLLSARSYHLIWTAMKHTKTGQNSIRAELPAKTIIAHKTGHSGTNKYGLTAAVNDMGIVFLPNGKYFYISLFVSNSKENETTNQKIIARISKAAWNYFTKK